MTTNAEILFDALAEHSPDKLDLIGAVARSIVEFHGATPADAKRIAAAIAASIAELTAPDPDSPAAARERMIAMIEEIRSRADRFKDDHGSPEAKLLGCQCGRCMSPEELAVSKDPNLMRVEVARLRVENTALAELNEALEAQVAMLTPEPFDPNDMSNPGARVIKRIQDIVDRRDKLAELSENPFVVRAKAAEATAANLQAQLDALLKLNGLLEQRLAMEVTA